ncbi:MAG: single-stranded-DNA-specific exonuclease RecJ [Velocimicrobium sp.]
MRENWFIKNKKGDFSLIAKGHQIDPVIAQLIVNRGIHCNEEMDQYLNPSLSNMHNPLAMKDIEKACELLKKKISEGRNIRVIGDYDVDGVMATYIFVTGLLNCGAKVDYEIPDRMRDGYGINIEIVKKAVLDGIDTILTCDNGIAAREPIQYAKEKNLTVIVTDHHDIPIVEGIPDADAVVNPKQEDCQYPYKGICGAMVAFKLMEVLYDKCLVAHERVHELFEYVAIATVCDVMDLRDENRIVVKTGISCFEQTKNIGLQALQEECGLLGKAISAYHFGFVIGPCINASGRLESAKLSLKLLFARKKEEASYYAKRLKELNDKRKKMTETNLQQAIEVVESSKRGDDKVLVVYLNDCHESLAGILAGRLRERYYKPTLVLTKTEHVVKGSGRSIEEYHMFEELSKCSDILLKFGGHPMAAGLSLMEENVDELRRRLNANTTLTEGDLTKKVSFDMVLPFEKIGIPLIRQMECLEPYGKGNEKPLFVLKDVVFISAQVLGVNKNVLKCKLQTNQAEGFYTGMIFQNIMGFCETLEEKYGIGAFDELLSHKKTYVMDVVFGLNINEYNGLESAQIIIQSVR